MSVTVTDNDVPAAVRAAAKAADERIREMMQAARGAAPQPQEPAGAPQASADAQAEGAGGEGGGALPAPTQPGSEPSSQSGFQVSPQPIPTAQPREDADSGDGPESVEELRRELAKAKHDAETWKGRHRAETARLQAQIDAFAARLDELIKGQSSQPGQPSQAGRLGQAPEVTEDDIEQYGDGLIDLIRRVASASVVSQVQQALAPVMAKLDALDMQVGTVRADTTQSRREQFLAALDAQVPEWRQLDTSDEFKAWLLQFDPLAMRTRKEVLDDALRVMNSDAVIAQIRAFLNQQGGNGSRGATAPAPAAAPPQPQAPAARTPQTTLLDLAAPGAARGSGAAAAAPAQAAKKVWTRAEIAKFYADVREGRYAANPQERMALELDILNAGAEGRIMG